MKELIVYEFEDTKFTPVPGPDGEPWFLASEVCAVLGHSNVAMAVKGLREDEKGINNAYTLGGAQNQIIISEPGLYKFLMRSRKKVAEKFADWLAHDVIPAIRKYGFFVDERQAEKVERLVPGLPLYLCAEDLPPLKRPVTTISTKDGLFDLVTGITHPRPYAH